MKKLSIQYSLPFNKMIHQWKEEIQGGENSNTTTDIFSNSFQSHDPAYFPFRHPCGLSLRHPHDLLGGNPAFILWPYIDLAPYFLLKFRHDKFQSFHDITTDYKCITAPSTF